MDGRDNKGENISLFEGILREFSMPKEAQQFLESIGIIGLHAVLASQNSSRWISSKQDGSFSQRFLDAARTLARNVKQQQRTYQDSLYALNSRQISDSNNNQHLHQQKEYPSGVTLNRQELENEIAQLNRQLDQLNHQIDAQTRKSQLTSNQQNDFDNKQRTNKEHRSFTGLPSIYVPQQSRNKRFLSPSSRKDITQKITSSPPPDLSQVIYEKRMACRQQLKREQLEGNQMKKALEISDRETKISQQQIPKTIQKSPSPLRNITRHSANKTGVNRSPNHSNRDLLIIQQQQLFSSDAFPQYKSAADQRQLRNMNHNNESASNIYLSPQQRNYQSPPPNPLQSGRKIKRISHPPSNVQYPQQGYPSFEQNSHPYQKQSYEYNPSQYHQNIYGQQNKQFQQSQYGSYYPEEQQRKVQQHKTDSLGLIPYTYDGSSDQDQNTNFRSKEQQNISSKQKGKKYQQTNISNKTDINSTLPGQFNAQSSVPLNNKPLNYMGSMYGIPFDVEQGYPYGSTESYPNELVKYMSVESNQNPSLGENIPLTLESQFLLNQQTQLQQQQRILGNPKEESEQNDYYLQQKQDPSITKGHPQGSQQFNSQYLQPWATNIQNPSASNNLFESEVLQHSLEGNKQDKGVVVMSNPFYRNNPQSPPQQPRGTTTQFSQNFQQTGVNDIANSFLSSPLVRHLNSLQNPFPGSPNVTQLKYSYLKPDNLQDSRTQQFTQAYFCQSVSPQKQSFQSSDNLSAGFMNNQNQNNILVSHNDQLFSPANLSSSWQHQQWQQQQYGQQHIPNSQQYLNVSKKLEVQKGPMNQTGKEEILFVSSPTFLDTKNSNNGQNHYYHQQHDLKSLPPQQSSSFSQNRTADFISTSEQEGRVRPNSFGIQQSREREKLTNGGETSEGEYEDKRRNLLNQAARGVEQRKQYLKGEKGVNEQFSRKQQQHQKNETRIPPQEKQQIEQLQKEEQDLDQEDGQKEHEIGINIEDQFEQEQLSKEKQEVDLDNQNEELRENEDANENQENQGYSQGIDEEHSNNQEFANNYQFNQQYEENSFQEQENISDRNNNSQHNNYNNDMKYEFLSSKASFGERKNQK